MVDGPHFLGHIIHHLVLDPRDGRTLLAAASKTGRTSGRRSSARPTSAAAGRKPGAAGFGPASERPRGARSTTPSG
jgi:hypothetical protein